MYTAYLAGVGIEESNDQATWQIHDGVPSLVLREGQLIATEHGDQRLQTYYSAITNQSGEVVARGRLKHPSSNEITRAVITGGPGSMKVVAQSGQQAPGTPEGVTFQAEGALLVFLIGQRSMNEDRLPSADSSKVQASPMDFAATAFGHRTRAANSS